ncbi:MAG TPA: hypothetical protein VG895_05250 [Patescibacteria group bacterium]|nr:hypothetical protein [Patescibacteria group bacterium]
MQEKCICIYQEEQGTHDLLNLESLTKQEQTLIIKHMFEVGRSSEEHPDYCYMGFLGRNVNRYPGIRYAITTMGSPFHKTILQEK